MQYYAAEVALYEIGYSKSQKLANADNHDFQRLDLLFACLQAVKQLFNAFFRIPAQSYLSFSLPTWLCMSNAVKALYSLSTFNHPDWNTVYVRQTLDLYWVIDEVSKQLHKAQQELRSDQNPIFDRVVTKLALVRKFCEGKMNPQMSADLQPDARNDQTTDVTRVPDLPFLDEASFRELMTFWDYEMETDVR
jgi:hypothetical protein